MDRYSIILEGRTPLLMHSDNLSFNEELTIWRKAPENKAASKTADDRSPAWTFLGYLYHDSKHICMDSDNIMSMLREAGAKVLTGKGKTTFKKQTQSGITLVNPYLTFEVEGKQIPVKPFFDLMNEQNNEFYNYMQLAQKHNFELFIKRARIGQSKHIRVRPRFNQWTIKFELEVLDAEVSGISQEILTVILNQAGAIIGLCDWRPSAGAAGPYGTFEPKIERIN